MKKVVVSIHDRHLADYILIDGKNLLFTKDKDNRRLVATYQTNRDEVTIASDTYHLYLQDNWWIKNMAIFLLSFFGIFAPRYMPRVIYHFVGHMKLEQDVTNVEIGWGWVDDAWKVEGAPIEVISNEKYADPRIRKRKRLLGWSKFLFILMFIALALLIVRGLTK